MAVPTTGPIRRVHRRLTAKKVEVERGPHEDDEANRHAIKETRDPSADGRDGEGNEAKLSGARPERQRGFGA